MQATNGFSGRRKRKFCFGVLLYACLSVRPVYAAKRLSGFGQGGIGLLEQSRRTVGFKQFENNLPPFNAAGTQQAQKIKLFIGQRCGAGIIIIAKEPRYRARIFNGKLVEPASRYSVLCFLILLKLLKCESESSGNIHLRASKQITHLPNSGTDSKIGIKTATGRLIGIVHCYFLSSKP